MKILVTGGAGFIGSHVVDAYVAAGHEVIVVDDLSTGRRENLTPKARFQRLDITDPALVELIRDVRPAVLNLHAAQMDVRRSVAEPLFDARVNILGTVNLLEAARKANVRRVLFVSSGGAVYGEQEAFPAPETHPTNPVSPYGVSKRAGELYAFFYQAEYRLPFVALRYANVYGPRQDPHGEAGVVAIFTGRMLRGEPVVVNGDGNQTRDYVYVGDVARANLLALETRATGPFNIGTGVETDVNTLASLLLAAAGSRSEVRHGPAKSGEQRRSVIDCRRAADLLGWRPDVPLAVRLAYRGRDGQDYVLNLIDTPGHVDFTYEVSRSLAACEGAILVVDASQGVQAQTVANAYLALDHDLALVPVINKIDLPSAEPERVRRQIEEIIGLDASHAILTSAKEGIGTDDVLEAVVRDIPPPGGDPDAPATALIFDSWFDPYHGAVVLVRVFDGQLAKGRRIRMMATGKEFLVTRVGVLAPRAVEVAALGPGEVGILMAAIKEVGDTKIGDTITDADRPAAAPLPGFLPVKPMVFSGLYPAESAQYDALRDAVEKLRLNDSSFTYEPETSLALGFGFRCGFLGLLHMEIVQERLEREVGLALIATAPTVADGGVKRSGEAVAIDSAAKRPAPLQGDHTEG